MTDQSVNGPGLVLSLRLQPQLYDRLIAEAARMGHVRAGGKPNVSATLAELVGKALSDGAPAGTSDVKAQ